MTSQIIPVDPFDFIIFGGTGDLSERKLLPSLYHRQRDHQFSEPTRIIGTSRSKMSDEEFQAFAKQAISEHVKAADIDAKELKTFLARLSYVSADATSGAGFDKLKKAIGDSDRIRAFYLAVAPALFGDISHKLKEHNLITPNSRIVLEKPIGRDLASARALNDVVGDDLPRKPDLPHRPLSRQGDGAEPDGAALRQRRCSSRCGTPPISTMCRSPWPRRVGAGRPRRLLRQGRRAARHGAEPHAAAARASSPWSRRSSMDADAVRDEKLKVLRVAEADHRRRGGRTDGARPVSRRAPQRKARCRATWRSCANDRSHTETFVALKAEIDNWRWAGVPFYLRTGKRLPTRVSEIVIAVPSRSRIRSSTASAGPTSPNRLVIRLQPDEGVKLWLMIKDPGPGRHAAAPTRRST